MGVLLQQLAFIDGIAFDPFFRGLLSVLTGLVVLVGGTYLVIATDTGVRLGFLISAAGFFGWLFLMGIIWTIYGIGWAGQAPTWSLLEINVDDAGDGDDGLLYSEITEVTALAPSSGGLPDGGLGELIGDIDDPDAAQAVALESSEELDLDGWRYLVTSDPIRGEAQASVDAFLVEEGVFETGEFIPEQYGAFIVDGKPRLVVDEDDNWFVEQGKRIVHTVRETVFNPVHGDELIVVQVRETVAQPTLPGQAPPVATPDESTAVVSVIMVRDRGGPFPALFSGLRFTPAMFTVFNGLIFAAFAWNMHVRDQRESKIRASVG